MAYSMNGPVVRYSWRINTMLGANGSTITGQRLSSGQWRQSGEDNRKAKYILNHNIGSWAYDKLHQGYTLGDSCYGLEYAMCRINLTEHAWDVIYRDQQSGDESPGVSFCVDNSWGAILASGLGIRDPADPRLPPKTWSWGIRSCVKDYVKSQLRTLHGVPDR